MKKWTIRRPDSGLAAQMKLKCDLSLLALKLLTVRGFNNFDDVVGYFNGGELDDPFQLKGMREAVEIINEYIDGYRRICVYGDYDCDGVTATALLYNYLENMGANVTYYINERSEGYGMNIDAIGKLRNDGVELIVTVDNGISCVKEAEEAQRLDMKLVITDHHQPPEIIPDAAAVIDPKQIDCPSEFKELAGVGVALKLCAALDGGSYETVLTQYADICSIGTVGDVVPLLGENRTIIRQGLMYLKNTDNPGLDEIMDIAGTDRSKLSSSDIAFKICPRINAAGRFGSPITALKAILTEDPDEAKNYAEEMEELNGRRKKTESLIMEDINSYIDTYPEILNRRVLIFSGKGWHHGVIGIVSARILDRFGKPNIVLSIDENGLARGSARSLRGFSIFDCLNSASEWLETYGGHECAGGLSIKEENIAEFSKAVIDYASGYDRMPCGINDCDMRIDPSELTVGNIKSLGVLGPFGAGNPEPLFYMDGCAVNGIYPLSGGKHFRLDVDYNGTRIHVLWFSHNKKDLFFSAGSRIDIAVRINVSEYMGKESLTVKAEDIRPSGLDVSKYFAARDCYERFVNGESLPPNYMKKITPQRREMVYVYKFLMRSGEITIDALYMSMDIRVFNYCKLRLILDIFREARLADISFSTQSVSLCESNFSERKDIMSTDMMKRILSVSGGVN